MRLRLLLFLVALGGHFETAKGGGVQPGPTFTVTNLFDGGDGNCTKDDCSLREALIAANADGDTNTIIFAPGLTGTIPVPANFNPFIPGGLGVSAPVTIIGPGARVLALRAAPGARIFGVSSGDVSISGLTITNGSLSGHNGGGVFNSGGLTLSDCMITANAAADGGSGGAIYNNLGAALTLVRCTVAGNSAGQFGGGVYNDGIFSATNLTFSGNTAVRGGGIISRFANGASDSTVLNCTVTGNTATSTSGGIADGGGGYYAEGGPLQHHVGNSVIAGNTNSVNPDVRGQFTSDGSNLIGSEGSSSTGFINGSNGDLVGTNASPIGAEFDAFGNNGGRTDTWSLLAISPAIDAGNDALAPPADQRDFSRAGASDIGAFEFDGAPPMLMVMSALSRKVHGDSGTFDIDLPLDGSLGIECRTGGAGMDYQVVVTFGSPVSVGGVVVVSIDGLARATQNVSGAEVTIDLTAATNVQTLGITLIDVNDGLAKGDVFVPMGVLVGDTNGNGAANASDIGQTKGQSGQGVSGSNFRTDVTANGGSINASDIGLVKSQSGTQLPP